MRPYFHLFLDSFASFSASLIVQWMASCGALKMLCYNFFQNCSEDLITQHSNKIPEYTVYNNQFLHVPSFFTMLVSLHASPKKLCNAILTPEIILQNARNVFNAFIFSRNGCKTLSQFLSKIKSLRP